MKKIPKLLPFNPHAAVDEQEMEYKVAFLNKVFFSAGILAIAIGFIRWQKSPLMGALDFGYGGLAFALLYYLRQHKEKIELVSSLVLIFSFILFFAVYLFAPYNPTRSALFFLLLASAFFLKGRRAGFLWLIFILLSIASASLSSPVKTAYSAIDTLTLGLYLIALFFIFDSYETVKRDQKRRLEQLNLQLEERIKERTSELQQANRLLVQLNEELDRKVKERTQQLVEAQDELVRKEKLAVLGQVAGSVGHELRNPLGVMNNAVYYLQTVLADADENVKEYLAIIKSEIAGSERIVSDLLDAVRTQPPQVTTVDIEGLIEQTLHRCSIPMSVTVKMHIPGTLPPLRTDPLQMQQVFRNLLTNGIEAMPNGGELEVSATADMVARTVTVSVRDSGIGITSEQLSKLFQPLYTTKPRGIGLGLVVVKNLIQANGGNIEVRSEAGKGSVFSVTLPAAQ